VTHTLPTRAIPASELREGYTVILPDGSLRVIAAPPQTVEDNDAASVVVPFEDRGMGVFSANELVTVVTTGDEF
jgi:hypothetical protein